MSKVSIVHSKDFSSVYDAVKEAMTLVGKPDLQGKRVLIKPNNLNASRNAVTDATVLGSIAKLVKELGGQPSIGDSPMSGAKTSEGIYKKVKYDEGRTGYQIIMEQEPSVQWVNFNEEPVLVSKKDYQKFERLERTVIAGQFINADFVINACKWKTHLLTRFTGAIKNYWGIQVGTSKSKSHLFGASPRKFSTVLTDLFGYIHEVLQKDNFVIMDAIDAMHGTGGPSFGGMVDLGLILASTDMVSLDAVAVNIGELDPLEDVKFIRECHDRGYGIGDLSQIEVLGNKVEDVRPVKNLSFPGTSLSSAWGAIQPVGNRWLKRVPRLKKSKCVKCGHCIEICPTESISFGPDKFPVIRRETCVNCLCCAEGCPQNAIRTPRAGLSGVLGIV